MDFAEGEFWNLIFSFFPFFLGGEGGARGKGGVCVCAGSIKFKTDLITRLIDSRVDVLNRTKLIDSNLSIYGRLEFWGTSN